LQELLSLLQPDQPGGVHVLSLHGMGGIGKTTLARELFRRLSYGSICFSSRLFLEVGQDTPLAEKQRELVQLLTGSNRPQVASTAPLRQQLQQCTQHAGPLLLVLDDIWTAPQRDALLSLSSLADGSRIILTGRDSSSLHPDSGSCVARPVEALGRDEAKRLLCQHAFATDRAPAEYDAAVQQALTVCGGLPLALQVVGAGMRSRPSDAAEVGCYLLRAAAWHAIAPQ
jgi:NB-ARC domain